ncbi:hypothetical protein SRABI106_01640 [Rahnella aquatilis]|jgi:hypothetical protein|nr:hypothetical protein SRABI106_01640 [Rahnella aquatilis]
MTYIAGRSAPCFSAVKWVEGCDLEIEFHCITSDLIYQCSEVEHTQIWLSALSEKRTSSFIRS